MAIETICKGCARKLRVGDEFAGRKARCPHCKTIYTVPAATADFETSSPPVPGSGDGWLLRTRDGAVYGPVSKSELDSWVDDGRVDAAAELQQEGDVAWRQAVEVYPALMPTAASSANPFASEPTWTEQPMNPYTAPREGGSTGRTYRPHRGGLILTFGLLGFVCCQIFSVAAWVMGHADMKEINAGRMDPAGRGLTQAGMIIGIIGTGLMVLTIAVQMIMAVFMVISA